MRDHENVCLTVALVSPLEGPESVGAANWAIAHPATARKVKRIKVFFLSFQFSILNFEFSIAALAMEAGSREQSCWRRATLPWVT